MRYKLFLFLFIIFLVPNVLAYDYDVTNNITAPTGPATGGHYLGLEIYNSGSQNNYTVNTRYNGTLSEIIFNLPLPSTAGQCFTTNMVYTITMEMATNDWRNRFSTPYISWSSNSTDWHSGNVTFVSMKKIYFKFKIPSTDTTCHDFVYVRLRSSSVSTTAFTGETNWNLSKIVLSDGYTNSGGSGGSGNSSTPTNQDIINNQTNNTSNIIDNANENTQIINDSLNSNCKNTTITLNYDYADVLGQSLGSSGNQVQLNGSAISKYFVIKPNTVYTISHLSGDTPSDFYYCLYSATKSVLSCSLINTSTDTTFTASNYASYLRVSMYNYRQLTLTGNICNNWEQEAQSETNKSVKDVNDTLKNPNIENGTGSDFFNNFTTSDNGGISAIVTKPLTIINNLLSNNNQCASLTLPSFMGVSNATLPSGCILWNNATTLMITLWNTFVCGLGSYFILKDIFRIIEDLKNPDNDKVEVMDL